MLQPIGRVHSCFKEKFGIPRQSGLIKSSKAKIELLPPYNIIEAINELESFSHIWLIFDFHLVPKKEEWKPSVRPPRLGGNKRIGVFASRSPFRPNNLGLSAVSLDQIEQKDGKVFLHISGQDLVDGTPILDIKPYLPQADCLPNANGGWTDQLTDRKMDLEIEYNQQAKDFLQSHSEGEDHLYALIEEILCQDPRPAYYREDRNTQKKTAFSTLLYDFDLHYNINENKILVVKIELVN